MCLLDLSDRSFCDGGHQIIDTPVPDASHSLFPPSFVVCYLQSCLHAVCRHEDTFKQYIRMLSVP